MKKLSPDVAKIACDIHRFMCGIRFSFQYILCKPSQWHKFFQFSLYKLTIFLLVLRVILLCHVGVVHSGLQDSPRLSSGNPLQNPYCVKLIKGVKSPIDLVIVAKSGFAQGSGLVNLQIISLIESGGRATVTGDGGKALGLFQITPGVVKDYNSASGTRYRHTDVLRPITAQLIAKWYLTVRIPKLLQKANKRNSVRNRLVAYNCGISCLSRPSLPKTTMSYLKKYQALGGSLL